MADQSESGTSSPGEGEGGGREGHLLDLCSIPPRMSEWGINTYLYAPKDDDKHRAC